MKKSRLWQIVVAITATITLASCSDIVEPEGKWDPMIWKTEVKAPKQDGAYMVPATGGELTFSCKNYQHPWIADAEYAGEYYNPDVQDDEHHPINWKKLTLDWFKAEITDNQLKVTFAPNQATTERPIKLYVTAGDIFYSFNFKQSANE